MIKIKACKTKEDVETIKMCDMEPLQVAQICEGEPHSGEYVMRTMSIQHFEVISISNPVSGNCWSSSNIRLRVRPLVKGEKLTVELLN